MLTDDEVEAEWAALMWRARFAQYEPKKIAEWNDIKRWPTSRRRECMQAVKALIMHAENYRTPDGRRIGPDDTISVNY